MDNKDLDEATLRAHAKYAGGGYFVAPNASLNSPSLVIHAPEMVARLLALLDAERAAHAEAKAKAKFE